MVLEKTLESPLVCKIQPVHPKGDQSWVFIGKTGAEAETSILWPPDAKSWLLWKDPDAGKDWRQEEKRTTEDQMVGWHHQLNGHEWVWINSGSWLWTGRPGVLRSMGSQRVRYDWATELNWTECKPWRGKVFTQGFFFSPSWNGPPGSRPIWILPVIQVPIQAFRYSRIPGSSSSYPVFY